MDLSLRNAIIQKVKDKSQEELYDVIESSVGGEERALPGIGVLFEIIWSHCSEPVKNELVITLKEHL